MTTKIKFIGNNAADWEVRGEDDHRAGKPRRYFPAPKGRWRENAYDRGYNRSIREVAVATGGRSTVAAEVTSLLNANERPGLAQEAEIREHMARAFFASAWADLQEEKDTDDETAVNLSGAEIMDVMPGEIDPAAVHAARTLAIAVLKANYGAEASHKSLASLLELVREIQADSDSHGDRVVDAENFGHYLAMQAMGTGVGLGDAFGSDVRGAIKVPYLEFGSDSLEKDY